MAQARKQSEEETDETLVGLHNLAPAKGSRKDRKRVGRGHGSGHGKTSGRGHKGYGARAGAKDRARFEGGQNPIHMRMRKLRGPNKKMSMPFEPFRTHTQPVNLEDLEARFGEGAAVDLDALRGAGRGGRAQARGPGRLVVRRVQRSATPARPPPWPCSGSRARARRSTSTRSRPPASPRGATSTSRSSARASCPSR